MSGPATQLLCLLTGVISFLGFQKPGVKERLLFRTERILRSKEWERLVSSALVHGDWMHLGCNLLALASFGEVIEIRFGPSSLLFIYLSSVLGGSLLSLFLHRQETYSALGASGGVCGVMFASIFMAPGTSVSPFLLPMSVPGPIFAGAYLVVTFIALRRRLGNVGHDAHFGGAIVGLALALVLAPERTMESPWLYLSACLFSAGCLFIIWRDRAGISDKVFPIGRSEYLPNVRYQRYDEARDRKREQDRIDAILDKVAERGIDSLSKKERAVLDQAASGIRKG